jgi:hypothetical protein
MCASLNPLYFLLSSPTYSRFKARQWNNAETLLKPFGKLKPTLLLMTWDKFQTDIAARERLLSLLWNDERARVGFVVLFSVMKC